MAALVEALRDLKQRIQSSTNGNSTQVYVNELKMLTSSLGEISLTQHAIEPKQDSVFALSHYTSLETMYNLISNGPRSKLRLYDTVHVNDPLEGKSTEISTRVSNFLKNTEETQNIDMHSKINAKRYRNAYILSFISQNISTDRDSTPGDELDLWRSYGRDGHGCSITFYPYLTNWPPELILDLRQVSYGREEVGEEHKVLELIFSIYMILLNRASSDSVLTDSLMSMRTIVDECFRRRFLIKDSAYRSEKEVRVIQFKDETTNIHYQLTKGGLRHYLEIDLLQLDKLCYSMTEIHVGPAVRHVDDVIASFKTLWSRSFRGTNVPKIYIKKSKIKYRPSLNP